MSRTKIVILVIIVALGAGGVYAWKEFTRTNKDLSKTKADYSISANDLISEFEKSDSLAALKYNGKVLEITGNVKKVEKDELGLITVILGENSVLSSVRCSMDTVYQADAASLSPTSSVTIRGACTGFNKDDLGLGSDVILNRCAVITNKK